MLLLHESGVTAQELAEQYAMNARRVWYTMRKIHRRTNSPMFEFCAMRLPDLPTELADFVRVWIFAGGTYKDGKKVGITYSNARFYAAYLRGMFAEYRHTQTRGRPAARPSDALRGGAA